MLALESIFVFTINIGRNIFRFTAMAGYNYELSTYKRVMAQRNGLIFEDAKDLNLALGQSVLAEGGSALGDGLGADGLGRADGG